MRSQNNISTYFLIVILTTIVSCGQKQNKEQNQNKIDYVSSTVVSKDSVIKNGNKTTILSTDIEKIRQLLDFKTYKPTNVKFKYTVIDNSGQNQRLTVPGPSDYSLQAILYFDSLTFEKFLDFDRNADYQSPNYKIDEFKFDWLENTILTELNNSNDNYHGHPDFFFKSKGKAWYLHRKIVISKITN